MKRVLAIAASLRLLSALPLLWLGFLAGCATRDASPVTELTVRDTIERYQANHAEQLAEQAVRLAADRFAWSAPRTASPNRSADRLQLVTPAPGSQARHYSIDPTAGGDAWHGHWRASRQWHPSPGHWRASRQWHPSLGHWRASRQWHPSPRHWRASRQWHPSLGHWRASRQWHPSHTPLTLGTFALCQDDAPASQPTATHPIVPEGYWRRNLLHQMGHEAKAFGGHGFWKGFKTSFWDLENALVLTVTMGASISIRETGVDHAIRRRTLGHRQLGSFDEPLQLLGHPGTHFAGAGVLWLTSTLMKDEQQHEVAKSLTQALAVNGVSTLLLKAAANTRTPDNERHGWPSGHTSSAFTVAAVLNEHYGPWVGVPSLALAGLVGYQRLDSRVHDFSDVVFGAMLGYVVGTSIARDNKAEFPELFGMKVIPFADPETGASGIALMKQW